MNTNDKCVCPECGGLLYAGEEFTLESGADQPKTVSEGRNFKQNHSDTHAEICGDSAAGSAAQFLMQLQTRTQRGNASAKPCLNKEMYGNQD